MIYGATSVARQNPIYRSVVARQSPQRGPVEGLRGDMAPMVYFSQINADLHVRFFPPQQSHTAMKLFFTMD
jgi:hypothetical protein